jgi:hypothetical protein
MKLKVYLCLECNATSLDKEGFNSKNQCLPCRKKKQYEYNKQRRLNNVLKYNNYHKDNMKGRYAKNKDNHHLYYLSNKKRIYENLYYRQECKRMLKILFI